MVGSTNLLLGRRGNFERCKYWVRDEDDEDLSQYTYENEPSGIFYAEEVTSEDLRKMVVNGVFMFDESLITLQTKGSVILKKGDLVEYEEDIWIVQTSQVKKVHKNEQFMKRPSTTTYIQLKK